MGRRVVFGGESARRAGGCFSSFTAAGSSTSWGLTGILSRTRPADQGDKGLLRVAAQR